MAQIRKNPPEETDRAVLFESTATTGFVLIRALQKDDSWREAVSRFLRSAKCEQARFTEVADAEAAAEN